MSSAIAYWPGDLNPAQFQTLAYSPSTNTLTLSPFGNSVVITPTTQTVSTINASTINTSNIFVNITNSSTINSYVENTTTVNSQTLNASTINTSNIVVSTINGQPIYNSPAVNYVDPYGTSPIVSTLGGSSVAITILPFSTLANHAYQVSVEYSAVNNGGGGANDATSLGITNSNTSVGLFGRYVAVDSWVTLDTYTVRRANVTAIFNTNSNNDAGVSVLEVLNESAAGNSQIVTIEQLAVKDLGLPSNVF